MSRLAVLCSHGALCITDSQICASYLIFAVGYDRGPLRPTEKTARGPGAGASEAGARWDRNRASRLAGYCEISRSGRATTRPVRSGRAHGRVQGSVRQRCYRRPKSLRYRRALPAAAIAGRGASAIARHLIRRQPTFPRMKMPIRIRTTETMPRKIARGTLWASLAPYQEPPLRLAARRAPNTKSSLP